MLRVLDEIKHGINAVENIVVENPGYARRRVNELDYQVSGLELSVMRFQRELSRPPEDIE